MTVNVTTAYSGVAGTVYWRPTAFSNQVRVWRSGAAVNLDMRINTTLPGARVYNAATQTWSGAQTNDILPAFQAGDRLLGAFVSAATLSADVSAESAGPVLTWEVKCDQGIS